MALSTSDITSAKSRVKTAPKADAKVKVQSEATKKITSTAADSAPVNVENLGVNSGALSIEKVLKSYTKIDTQTYVEGKNFGELSETFTTEPGEGREAQKKIKRPFGSFFMVKNVSDKPVEFLRLGVSDEELSKNPNHWGFSAYADPKSKLRSKEVIKPGETRSLTYLELATRGANADMNCAIEGGEIKLHVGISAPKKGKSNEGFAADSALASVPALKLSAVAKGLGVHEAPGAAVITKVESKFAVDQKAFATLDPQMQELVNRIVEARNTRTSAVAGGARTARTATGPKRNSKVEELISGLGLGL